MADTDHLDAGAARVTVLFDVDDDVAVTRKLLRAHDPAGGYLVVHPTPAVSSTKQLAHDLLNALGRPVGRLAGELIAGAAPAFTAVTAWMIADRVAYLVVLRADRISPFGTVKSRAGRAIAALRRPAGPLANEFRSLPSER